MPQAAFALSDEQTDMVCNAYESLMTALERAAADQNAFLAGRPQHPSALWIAQNVSFGQTSRVEMPLNDELLAAVVRALCQHRDGVALRFM